MVLKLSSKFSIVGSAGRNGITGASGVAGVKGENGATGASGFPGQIGDTGMMCHHIFITSATTYVVFVGGLVGSFDGLFVS